MRAPSIHSRYLHVGLEPPRFMCALPFMPAGMSPTRPASNIHSVCLAAAGVLRADAAGRTGRSARLSRVATRPLQGCLVCPWIGFDHQWLWSPRACSARHGGARPGHARAASCNWALRPARGAEGGGGGGKSTRRDSPDRETRLRSARRGEGGVLQVPPTVLRHTPVSFRPRLGLACWVSTCVDLPGQGLASPGCASAVLTWAMLEMPHVFSSVDFTPNPGKYRIRDRRHPRTMYLE
jgi:hypothetical protein